MKIVFLLRREGDPSEFANYPLLRLANDVESLEIVFLRSDQWPELETALAPSAKIYYSQRSTEHLGKPELKQLLNGIGDFSLSR